MDEKINWRKATAAALAGLGMATASPMVHGHTTTAQWDQTLNRSWMELSPEQRQELRQEERNWIKWRDSLSSDDDRRDATKSRAWYLWWIKDPKGITAPDPATDEERDLERVGMAMVQQQGAQGAEATPVPTMSDEQIGKLLRGAAAPKAAPTPETAPAPTEVITSSTNNWVITAVRKYLARRGAPADIGAPAKLVTFDYTGQTTVEGEKMFAAMLIVNMIRLHITGYGHEIISFEFEK